MSILGNEVASCICRIFLHKLFTLVRFRPCLELDLHQLTLSTLKLTPRQLILGAKGDIHNFPLSPRLYALLLLPTCLK